ncbi:MAG: DUF4431 domain-containing protein [Clostridiales Family XIII bacterium]|nr:DUF4431 domain-containing protein [Clostridiales Family XIII bacterium]
MSLSKSARIALAIATIMSLSCACSIQGPSSSGQQADTVECSGVLQTGRFYHDASEEWLDFYYIDLGEEQYETLAAAYTNMDFAQAPGSASELMQTAKETQENPYEIQVISSDESLDISSFVGKTVRFSGSFFDAHTAYHVRYIVFHIESIEAESAEAARIDAKSAEAARAEAARIEADRAEGESR